MNYNRAFEDFLRPVFEASAHRINPAAVQKAGDKLQQNLKYSGPGTLLHHRFFARLLLPALSGAVERSVYGQAAVDAAAVACALERYRLARGSYPDTLEVLAPQFISRVPPDAITGQPLKYRRTEGGEYLLYSVGWNEKDDGGVIATNKTGQSVNMKEGDWVWRPLPAGRAK